MGSSAGFGLLRGLESSVMTKIKSFESKRKHWQKNKKITSLNTLGNNNLGLQIFAKRLSAQLKLLAMGELLTYIWPLIFADELTTIHECKAAKFNGHS